jgi:uncharacterized membrane protein
MTYAAAARLPHDTASRRLLLVSLALNLFFIGVAVAFLVRSYYAEPARPAAVDRSVAARIERLAASLPATDAEKLRAEFRAHSAMVEPAREAYRRTQDAARAILRAEPFDVAALRAAMRDTRAARLVLDEALNEAIAAAAAQMSHAGRGKLADWPPGSRAEMNR